MRRLRDLLTTRGRAFVAAGITLVLCGIGLGFTDLTRIGVLLVALPLLSGALMRRHDLRFALERTAVPGRVQVDEQALVTLGIENAGAGTSPLLMAEEQLDYAPLTIPVSYQGKDGRQYVAVMAAGSSLAPASRTPEGKPANNESLIAFALPK